MKILSINAGSSSLKFTLFELPKTDAIASGVFEKIGLKDSFYTIKYDGEKTRKEVYLKDHAVAVDYLMKDLVDMHIVSSLAEIEGVGHRILHGGAEFTKPVVLSEDVIERISKYNELGPLHNPANLLGVKAFMKALPGVINVGVFDTGFHQTMDEEHFLYPVPYEWYTNYGVRKYGFHGTSHRFVYGEICKKLENEELKVITCHIGNGASLCAIDEGKVIDTSMGFTPLAGVMMGTRCGDIDPSILEYVCNKTGKTISEVTNDLNKKSGFLGISEISSDARDVENAAMEGNKMAILAENMYAQKIANYIAVYNNMLNGADAIVFTAGVGENSARMRKMVIDRVKSLGVKLDDNLNNVRGEYQKISAEDSTIAVYVLPTNEELLIAQDTLQLKREMGD
ncbi:MAG: acetate/propionate family kinase [Bacilli bacterium]